MLFQDVLPLLFKNQNNVINADDCAYWSVAACVGQLVIRTQVPNLHTHSTHISVGLFHSVFPNVEWGAVNLL